MHKEDTLLAGSDLKTVRHDLKTVVHRAAFGNKVDGSRRRDGSFKAFAYFYDVAGKNGGFFHVPEAFLTNDAPFDHEIGQGGALGEGLLGEARKGEDYDE